jgi:hypothetical protein
MSHDAIRCRPRAIWAAAAGPPARSYCRRTLSCRSLMCIPIERPPSMATSSTTPVTRTRVPRPGTRSRCEMTVSSPVPSDTPRTGDRPLHCDRLVVIAARILAEVGDGSRARGAPGPEGEHRDKAKDERCVLHVVSRAGRELGPRPDHLTNHGTGYVMPAPACELRIPWARLRPHWSRNQATCRRRGVVHPWTCDGAIDSFRPTFTISRTSGLKGSTADSPRRGVRRPPRRTRPTSAVDSSVRPEGALAENPRPR